MHLLITCKIIAYPKLLHLRIDIFKFLSFVSLHFLKTHWSNCCFFMYMGVVLIYLTRQVVSLSHDE